MVTLKAEKQKAEGRARELEALNKRQTKYVTNWHANRKVVLPNLATVEGQSGGLGEHVGVGRQGAQEGQGRGGRGADGRHDGGEGAERAAASRRKGRGRARWPPGPGAGAGGAHKTQTEYVTDWHTDHKEELPDLATVEGSPRPGRTCAAWKAEALKKARDRGGDERGRRAGAGGRAG